MNCLTLDCSKSRVTLDITINFQLSFKVRSAVDCVVGSDN